MMIAPLSLKPSAGRIAGPNLLSLFGRLYDPWSGMRRNARSMQDIVELYEMDDHMLWDIGLSRLDVLRMLETIKR